MSDTDNGARKGYLFGVRVGGGPLTYTAWTVQDDGYEPFTQATGASPEAALRALADKIDGETLARHIEANRG